jgi:hypothetical protein
MDEHLNFRWFLTSALFGFGMFAVGTFVRGPSQSTAPVASQARDGVDDQPESIDGGLLLACRNDDECIKTSESDWNDGQGPLWRKFLRVRIYNEGVFTAKGCKVTLRAVLEHTSDGIQAIDYDGPRLLIWSGDPSSRIEGKSIPSNGNPALADLFYTVHKPAGDEIHLKDESYTSSLKFGRTYGFVVIATAEGLRAVRRIIKIRFGQNWNDFEVVRD